MAHNFSHPTFAVCSAKSITHLLCLPVLCMHNFVTQFHYPELKGESGWTRLGLARTFPLSKELVKDNCERISYLDVDEQSFVERYEHPAIPVVITDSQLDWQANKKWTIEVCVESICSH